jgi:hypothetical protein
VAVVIKHVRNNVHSNTVLKSSGIQEHVDWFVLAEVVEELAAVMKMEAASQSEI